MKKTSERSARSIRRSYGSRRTTRSLSKTSKKRSASASEKCASESSKRRSASASEKCASGSSKKRSASASEKCASEAKKRKKSSHSSQDEIKKKSVVDKQICLINNNLDQFCWICHKIVLLEDIEKFKCPDCSRIYHNACLKKIKSNPSEPICECKWTTVDGTESQTNHYKDLGRILILAFHAVVKENKYKSKEHNNDCKMYMESFNMWPEFEENALLCEIVDFTVIWNKLHLRLYKCTGEFFQDVKWIHHNCYIIGPNHKLTAIAEKLKKAIKQQLSYAEGCAQCYLETDVECSQIDYFVRVCNIPHLIVWAKLKGFPYWPAKCLRVVNGHADVTFFGTHDKALVPHTQVYKISRQNPGGNPKKSKPSLRKTSYEEAMEELCEYIKHYQKQYGTFKYFDEKTPLIPTKKSQNKGRQGKNKEQLDASMSAEDLSETNLPIIHTPFTLGEFTNNDNVILDQNAAGSNVYYHLEFTEDSSSETKTLDQGIASIKQPTVSEISYQNSVSSIKSSQQFVNLPSSQASLNSAETSQIATDTSSAVPPLPLLITSTQSLSDTFSDQVDFSKSTGTEKFFSDDYAKKLLEDSTPTNILGNISTTINLINILGKISSFLASTNTLENISSSLSSTNTPIDDDDDDIQVIFEHPTVDEILKSPYLRSFCESIVSNKALFQNYILVLRQLLLHMYLMAYAEIKDCKIFFSNSRVLEKVIRKFEILENEVAALKKENDNLKKTIDEYHTEKENRTKLADLLVQAHFKKNDEDLSRYRRQVRQLKKEKEDQQNEINKLTTMSNEKDEENRHLKEQIMVLTKEQEKINYENLIKQNELAEKEKKIENVNLAFKKEREKIQIEIEYISSQQETMKQDLEFYKDIFKGQGQIKKDVSPNKNSEQKTSECQTDFQRNMGQKSMEQDLEFYKDKFKEQGQIKIDMSPNKNREQKDSGCQTDMAPNKNREQKDSECQTDMSPNKNREQKDSECQTDMSPNKNREQKDSVCQTDMSPNKNREQKDSECQTDFQSSNISENFYTVPGNNLNSSFEHIMSQKTQLTNVQVIEYNDGSVEFSTNTTMQNQSCEQHIMHPLFAIPSISGVLPVHISQALPRVLIPSEPEQTSSINLSTVEHNQSSCTVQCTVTDSPKSKSSENPSKSNSRCNVKASVKKSKKIDNDSKKKSSKRKRK